MNILRKIMSLPGIESRISAFHENMLTTKLSNSRPIQHYKSSCHSPQYRNRSHIVFSCSRNKMEQSGIYILICQLLENYNINGFKRNFKFSIQVFLLINKFLYNKIMQFFTAVVKSVFISGLIGRGPSWRVSSDFSSPIAGDFFIGVLARNRGMGCSLLFNCYTI